MRLCIRVPGENFREQRNPYRTLAAPLNLSPHKYLESHAVDRLLGHRSGPNEKERYTTETRSPNIYPAEHTAAGPMDKSEAAGAENDKSRQNRLEALQETQQALTPAKGRLTTAKSQKR
jgi:hypothetical protein